MSHRSVLYNQTQEHGVQSCESQVTLAGHNLDDEIEEPDIVVAGHRGIGAQNELVVDLRRKPHVFADGQAENVVRRLQGEPEAAGVMGDHLRRPCAWVTVDELERYI